MNINRCISIRVWSVCSHKFAHLTLNTLYRNSVCITATLSAMLSWCYGVVAASALHSCHHTFTIYLQKNIQPPIPVKGPLGSIPRLKAVSLLGAASTIPSGTSRYPKRFRISGMWRVVGWVVSDVSKAALPSFFCFNYFWSAVPFRL